MKTFARILTTIVLLLFVAAPVSEAISIKPKTKLGQVLHAIGKSGRTVDQLTVAEYYKGLGEPGRRGLHLIISAAIKEKGQAPSASHVIRALSRVAGTLKLSAHNMTLKEFLEELPKLKKQFKNDPESLLTFDRMLVGLTTKVKQSGVHEMPMFTHALGTSAELAECSRLLPVIKKLGPRVGGRKWVEAMCEGVVAVGGKFVGMADEWMLEVKCWRKFKGKRAIERLKTQASSTYQRLYPPVTFNKVTGEVEAPGYVVRFAAAGQAGENLGAHKASIKQGVRQALIEIAIIKYGSIAAIPPNVQLGIKRFVSNKVMVELVQ